MPYYFYCLTNKINQKKYIGITRNLPKIRFYQHRIGYKVKKENKLCPIDYAMAKYGKNSFIYEVLGCLDTDDEVFAKEIEERWINYFNSYVPNGYNAIKNENFNYEKIRSKKQYKIVDPKGNLLTIDNLPKFCLDHNIDEHSLRNNSSSEGYYLYDYWLARPKCKRCNKIRPIDSKGELCTECQRFISKKRKPCRHCGHFKVVNGNKSGYCKDCQRFHGLKTLKKGKKQRCKSCLEFFQAKDESIKTCLCFDCQAALNNNQIIV